MRPHLLLSSLVLLCACDQAGSFDEELPETLKQARNQLKESARYNENGNHVWSFRPFTGAASDVRIRSLGDRGLMAAGLFYGRLGLGGGELRSPHSNNSVFLTRLSAEGGHRWSRVLSFDSAGVADVQLAYSSSVSHVAALREDEARLFHVDAQSKVLGMDELSAGHHLSVRLLAEGRAVLATASFAGGLRVNGRELARPRASGVKVLRLHPGRAEPEVLATVDGSVWGASLERAGDGGLLLFGTFSGRLHLGKRSLGARKSSKARTILIRLENGRVDWVRSSPLRDSQQAFGLSVTANGTIRAVHSSRKDVAEGDGASLWVTAYGPEGKRLWGHAISPAPFSISEVTTSGGETLIAGDFLALAQDAGLSSPPVLIEVLGKGEVSIPFELEGDSLWMSSAASAGPDSWYLAGSFKDYLDLGGGPLTSPQGGTAFFAKLKRPVEH